MVQKLTFFIVSMFLIVACGEIQGMSFKELIFIDHENLRYVEGKNVTQFQVNQIKQNIDQAKKYGVSGYLLFAKETMEAMLTYDFDVEGIGNIGEEAFPPDSMHRRQAE